MVLYLGDPSLAGGRNINPGISGGQLLVFGGAAMFNPSPPPSQVIGYQAHIGFGVGQMPVAAAVDASYAWTKKLETCPGGKFGPAPGLPGLPPGVREKTAGAGTIGV